MDGSFTLRIIMCRLINFILNLVYGEAIRRDRKKSRRENREILL